MKRILLILTLFFYFVPNSVTFSPEEYDPVANSKAVVKEGDVRFTVLTSQLLRMEWSKDGKFEDSASLVFIRRNLPVPEFESFKKDGWLFIKTKHLLLKYKIRKWKIQ